MSVFQPNSSRTTTTPIRCREHFVSATTPNTTVSNSTTISTLNRRPTLPKNPATPGSESRHPQSSISTSTTIVKRPLFAIRTLEPLHTTFTNQPIRSLCRMSASDVRSTPANRRSATVKEQPDYYAALSAVDEGRTLGEFEHFLKLPIEIIGLVVEQCAVQDGVCLSLASKDLYTLTRPILLRRNIEAYSLSLMSKYECRHFRAKTGGHKPCALKGCRNTAAVSGRHCLACTSCPLYIRLGNDNWSGLSAQQFFYCSNSKRWGWVNDVNGGRKRHQTCWKFRLKKKFLERQMSPRWSSSKPRKEGQGSLTWTNKKRVGRMAEGLEDMGDFVY